MMSFTSPDFLFVKNKFLYFKKYKIKILKLYIEMARARGGGAFRLLFDTW
jgi:hypothetical protein